MLRRLALVPLVVVGFLSILASGGGGGGGGGDGGGTPESPATITSINAAELINDVMGTSDPTGGIAAASTRQGTSRGQSVSSARALAKRLETTYQSTLSRAQVTTQRFAPAISVDDTQPCDFGQGTIHFTGNINPDGTGTLNATYTNCLLDGLTHNGQGTLQVTAFNLTFFIPTDFTFSTSSLTVTGPGVNVTLGGSLRDQLNIVGDRETVTFNTITTDHNAGKTIKAHNLVFLFRYSDIFSSCPSATLTINGRLWDSRYGYVDVSQATGMAFHFASCNQLFPDSGQMILFGTNNASIRVTALSSVSLTVEVDLDGDGAYELTTPLKWTDLVGPIGADLGDDDGDGMHNSWEIFYGLNPSDPADAGVDGDGDGSTNLQEYQVGTDPTNPLSGPPTADLAITNTDAPDPVNIGASIVYTIQVTNIGPANATDVVVTDTLPSALAFVSVTTSQGSCFGSTTITCNLGFLSSGSVVTISLTVGASVEGLHTSTASVTSGIIDPALANNSATATTGVGTLTSGLQAMIDAANPGDTIVVPPGFYIGGLDFSGKDITLVSSDGPATTIIYGNSGTAVRMGPGGTITGFTITGAAASFGAGITVSGAGSLISGNVFDGNLQSAGGFGAAIGGDSASPAIEQNVFRNNSCDDQFLSGVVAFVNSSSPLIVNNIFENNPCRAINLTLPAGNMPVVTNNTLIGNRTGVRVDRQVSQVTQTYRNNMIVQNDIGLELANGTDTDNPVWENNLVFGNSVDYQGTADKTGTAGNISVDPFFIDLPGGDYHLEIGSPAIDAGSALGAPAVDFDGTARPLDGDGDATPTMDIGAFEAPQLVGSLDQQQPLIADPTVVGGAAIGGSSKQMLAQVVTAGLTGVLTQVRLPVVCSDDDLIVEIQGVAGGIPDGMVLTSETFPGASLPSFFPDPPRFRSLVFSAPAPVSAGSVFAIVLRSAGGPGACGVFLGPIGDPYPGGDALGNALPDSIWVPVALGTGRSDLPFQTIVQ